MRRVLATPAILAALGAASATGRVLNPVYFPGPYNGSGAGRKVHFTAERVSIASTPTREPCRCMGTG